MSTNLKLPLNAEPRPLQPGAGIPARLVAAVENFKSAMLAVDRLIADAATADAEIQNRVGEACALVTDHLRGHIELNRSLEHRVGAFVFRETYPYFGYLALSVVVSALQARSPRATLPKAMT